MLHAGSTREKRTTARTGADTAHRHRSPAGPGPPVRETGALSRLDPNASVAEPSCNPCIPRRARDQVTSAMYDPGRQALRPRTAPGQQHPCDTRRRHRQPVGETVPVRRCSSNRVGRPRAGNTGVSTLSQPRETVVFKLVMA